MNAGLVIVTSISLVIAGATGLSCTGGFVNNAVDSEYCFKIEGFDPKTHNEAVNDCFNQGSQLVAVTSKKDEQVVYSILHDNEDAKYCDDFWLAYDYDTDKEAYEWTAENVTLDQLAQQSIYGHSYGCISGKLKESGKWHIHSCIAKLCYICKKQMKFDIPTDHKPLEPVAKASPSCPKDSCRQKQRQSDAVHSRRDCLDLFEAGERKSGIYKINPSQNQEIDVYCDMETHGGGWTVIQRRSNGNYEFWDKKWDEYENGFMDSVGLGEGGNSWIGLKAISDLTADESWLRVELRQDRAPNSKYANEYWFEEYDFGVNDASTNYSLRISIDWRTHIGNASSGWFDITVNNGRPFSTVDRINDPHKPCVTERHLGGWWLYYCSLSSLNGEYIPKEYASGYGMAWVVMGEYTINPGSSIMMVKRK